MEVKVSAHGSNLPAVVQQEEIPLCRSIKLRNLNVSEPADEFPPHLGPHPVSNGESHPVASVVELLSGRKQRFNGRLGTRLGAATRRTDPRRVAQVAHDFPDVLDDGDVILPAVVPELGGRKLTPQHNRETCTRHKGDLLTLSRRRRRMAV